jgi:Family of unknown function (DUF5994)
VSRTVLLPRSAPVSPDPTLPARRILAAVAPDGAGEAADAAEDAGAVRLTLLDAVQGEHTMLDGAWWPHSDSLVDELPPLIAELRRRGAHITRVTYNPDLWGPAPRRLEVDGRIIHLGWFRGIDPHLLGLTEANGRHRLDLLVVPPGTTRADAARAMTEATARKNRHTPTAVLDAYRAVPGEPVPEATVLHAPSP